MDPIRWYQANLSPAADAALDGVDRYRIDIDGVAAVLITYLGDLEEVQGFEGPSFEGQGETRPLLAVAHPAASHYPPPPPHVVELLEGLTWLRRPPPG